MDVNLNLLKYFYEAVKEKNITKAAEKSYITQPAMTRAIKELENQLKTKLLERSQKGVVPTNDGLILYKHIENIFKEIDITKQIIENNKQTDLYIGTTTSNLFDIIIKVLNIFKEKLPDIRVHIFFDKIEILDELSKVGKLDIVIKSKEDTIYNFNKVDEFEINNIFIASKKHYSNLDNKFIDINTLLENYPLVIMTNESPGRRNFNNFLKSLNIEYTPTYEFNSYDLCKKLIENGIGIGIGSSYDFDKNNFIIINTNKLPTRYFEIGYMKSSKNPYINQFLDIYNEIKKHEQ